MLSASRRRLVSATLLKRQFSSRIRSALVVGSSGALGRSVCQALSSTPPEYAVTGADVLQANLENFVHLNLHGSVSERGQQLVEETYSLGRFDVVICTAGGWTGDPQMPRNPKNAPPTLEQRLEFAGSYLTKLETMHRMNLEPAVLASLIPAKLHIYVGAAATLGNNSGMMAYNLAKSSIHKMVQINKSICILPTVLDTTLNRQNMEYDASWVKPDDIAMQIKEWLDEPNLQPHPGALIKVHRNNKKLRWTLA